MTAEFKAASLAQSAGHRQKGYAAGLAAAAAIADRYGDVQQAYADQCETTMPNSIHAFLLQKLMAQRVGAEIRALLPAPTESGG
jgi:hypothetical protein